MLPSHYFDVICCPACKQDLKEETPDRLTCAGCRREYPIADGIPVLLFGLDDEVSKKVSEFYATAWRRNSEGTLRAKIVHDDLTDLGHRYALETATRFSGSFRDRGRAKYFLDAASGAQPRMQLGSTFEHHICVDFSLDGLAECRKRLGERAIVVCGSLLNLPIRTGLCDGIVASHCIYHIAKEHQATAVHELSRALRPGGRMLIFYANPEAIDSPLLQGKRMTWLRYLIKRGQAKEQRQAPETPDTGEGVYTYLHPIEYMTKELSTEPSTRVHVKPLCLFAQAQSAPALRSRVFGKPLFNFYMFLERMYEERPDKAYFLTYIVDK